MATGGGNGAAGRDVAGVNFTPRLLDGVPARELKSLADDIKKQVGSGVVALVGTSDGKASVVVGVTDDLTARINAVDLAKIGAHALGGKGGGGRADMAQAGGPDPSQAQAALDAIERALGRPRPEPPSDPGERFGVPVLMAGRPRVVATAEQRGELRALAGSSDRAEADRARAILLSLEGWSSVRIAEAFSVEPDSVRHWRWTFGREGVAGLRARKAPGPEPVKARAALSVVSEVLADEVSDRPNWTLPRLQDEIEARTGERISKSRLSVVMRKKGASAGGGRGTR